MLTSIVVTPINHILHGESWARKRLQAYTGKTARIRILPFPDFIFSIQVNGKISTLSENTSVDTVITLTPALLLRILANGNDETIFNDIKISGDNAFAKELFYIGRHLHWDLEQDLSGIVGDIFSHRIIQTGENLVHWQTGNIQNLSQALAEYWTEEQPMLTNKTSINGFNHEVKTLHHDTEQLEQRIQKLINQQYSLTRIPISNINEENP
jgi:ubiquinone biosynthesis protein UbiJ